MGSNLALVDTLVAVVKVYREGPSHSYWYDYVQMIEQQAIWHVSVNTGNPGYMVVGIRTFIDGDLVDSGQHWAAVNLCMNLGQLLVSEDFVVHLQV